MATNSSNPITCLDVGSDFNKLQCCYAADQTSSACQNAFSQADHLLSLVCPIDPQKCATDCSNKQLLYTSLAQDNLTGNGLGPIVRYQGCVNFPSLARHYASGQLPSNVSNTI